MGIVPRVQQLMSMAGSEQRAHALWEDYVRLAHPEQMGAIYKMFFMAHQSRFAEVFPFTTTAV